MIELELNRSLLLKHYKHIYPKIKDKIKKEIALTSNTINIKYLIYIQNRLSKIIVGDTNYLEKTIKLTISKYSDIATDHSRKKVKPEIYDIIKRIFVTNGYESYFSKENKTYYAYNFTKELGLHSCPYCNRNYISTIERINKNNKKTRPQIDHFFPKAIYPFLAISFYNLLPCCTTCNHMKSNDDSYIKKLKSPYEIQNEDFKFSYLLNGMSILDLTLIDDITCEDEQDIKIILDKKIISNNKCFELEKLYEESHQDIVIELIVKKLNYPNSYINELKNFGFSKNEIYRYLLCNYSKINEFHKRPLSKLISDIADELNLIEI